MEDLAALAMTLVGGVGDARGSLILSRDGLVLGAHPEEAEGLLKGAWLRMASLGEPERGFIQFGTETWCYVRRGPYAAFVIVGVAVRPGVAIDRMEQALLAAEEARTRREGVRADKDEAPSPAAATTKPRTPLHPEHREVDRPVVIHPDPAPNAAAGEQGPAPSARSAEGAPPAAVRADGEPAAPAPPEAAEGETGVWGSAPGAKGDEREEVDRFSLAREFSQLLQEDADPADG